MVYDVSDPRAVSFVQYLRKLGDESPEGLTFVSGADSPSGGDLLIVTNEVSNTVSLFEDANYNNPADNGTLSGDAGANMLKDGRGHDILNGGDGIDTAVFNGKVADYVVARTTAGFRVQDTIGTDGTDSLSNIERLAFVDRSLAFDLDGAPGQAYRLFFGACKRVPTASELGDLIDALAAGKTLAQLAGELSATNEFKAAYGAAGSDADFVEALYRHVLGRAPDSGGQAYWEHVLANGTSRSQALVGFVESTENRFAQKVFDLDGGMGQLVRLYEVAFDRPPDVGGLDYWLDEMQAGQTLTGVAGSFLSSPEFALSGPSLSDAELIALLHQNAFGRAPDLVIVEELTTQLASGAARAEILVGLSESLESKLMLVGVAHDGVAFL